MSVAVGIMAYNEGPNIAAAVRSVLDQIGPHLGPMEVVLVASGCTDDTVPRARREAAADPRFRILEESRRAGKAAAIGALLDAVSGHAIVVLVGGDTRPAPGALEALVAPFDDPSVGMTGGRPVPLNPDGTRLGRVVQLLWEMHHRIALRTPKLGELVAFRPVFGAMPADTAVDEARIEALILERGLRLTYVPEARVFMKGPATVGDYLAQRRRIHAGHLRLRRTTGHRVSTMGSLGIWRAAREAGALSPGGVGTFASAAVLETAARLLGWYDATLVRRDHAVWRRIDSTKDLAG